MVATVVSVNVGSEREVLHNGRTTTTGIWKDPVEGRVEVHDHRLGDDHISNLENHGGEHKAVYAYGADDMKWWRQTHRRIIVAGAMGENLTIDGLDVSNATIGDRWKIGSAVLEVAGPRTPCFKLGLRHDDQDIVEEFRQSLRWGAYLRIISEGDLGKGDEVEVVPAKGSMTVADVATIYLAERHRAVELLEVRSIGEEWIRFANDQIAKASETAD